MMFCIAYHISNIMDGSTQNREILHLCEQTKNHQLFTLFVSTHIIGAFALMTQKLEAQKPSIPIFYPYCIFEEVECTPTPCKKISTPTSHFKPYKIIYIGKTYFIGNPHHIRRIIYVKRKRNQHLHPHPR